MEIYSLLENERQRHKCYASPGRTCTISCRVDSTYQERQVLVHGLFWFGIYDMEVMLVVKYYILEGAVQNQDKTVTTTSTLQKSSLRYHITPGDDKLPLPPPANDKILIN